MILQELNRYYERKISEDDSEMPSFGTSVENISFALVLGQDGELLDVEDQRRQEGKQLGPRKVLVPAPEKKTSGVNPNFLWGSTSYVLGLDNKDNQERTDKCHEAFVEQVNTFCGGDDAGLNAVVSFFKHDCRSVALRSDWGDVCGTNLVFRLSGTPGFIHERAAAHKAWGKCLGQREVAMVGQCLVSGEDGQPLARLHPSIKGVRGTVSMGASIVSFNNTAFESYGKKQSINAPVSEKAAFNYVTALNTLLAADSRQKVVIGDTTIVFWAECRSVAEALFANLFAPDAALPEPGSLEDDQQTAGKIFYLLQNIRSGKLAVDVAPELDPSVRFFILGLAPNTSRLSIRFWLEGTVGHFLEQVATHFRQLEIVRQFATEPEFPPLWRLLCQTATLGKSENVLPVLAGGITKAMLNGGLYPYTLLAAVLSRIRAEREVGYFRAALLKAFLVRNKKMEISMYYDPNKKDVPYLLGGLFAVLEKAQTDAIPGTTATMKDRFFGSAPATPARVFPMLLKNAANHIAKLRKNPEKTGWAINLDRAIQDTVADLTHFPPTMSPEEQGMFMIGYYQRMKDLYTSKKAVTAKTTEEN